MPTQQVPTNRDQPADQSQQGRQDIMSELEFSSKTDEVDNQDRTGLSELNRLDNRSNNNNNKNSAKLPANGVQNSNNYNKNNIVITNNKTAKLNGLKNRIIQRPPPLILDKVSNFYDTNEHSQQQQQQSSPTSITNSINNKPSNFNNSEQATANEQINSSIGQQQVVHHQSITNNNNNNIVGVSNSANHKFWASLNQSNAQSRTRGQLIVGGRAKNGCNNGFHSTNIVTDSKDLPDSGSSSHLLGADLIITHRNSGSNDGADHQSIVVGGVASSRLITSSSKQQKCATSVDDSNHVAGSIRNEKGEEQVRDNSSPRPIVTEVNNNNTSSSKSYDMSNNSELDDASTHGVSENGGGNLIGVDHPTPPTSTGAVSDSHRIDDPPLSASGSRPRSNNPFLASDDELIEAFNAHNLNNHTTSSHNHFHKRPASFIAATDSASVKHQQTIVFDLRMQQPLHHNHHNQHNQHNHHLQQQHSLASDSNSAIQQSLRDNNPNAIQANTGESHQPELNAQLMQPQENPYERGGLIFDRPQDENQYLNCQSAGMNQQQQAQSVYGVYCRDGANYIEYQPTISIDSETTICKPPPSATMQLPHWTDAIYELNNAILEAASLAGGAENGEFIYINENGDIILELDQIKVSGFTLAEFKELVETKPVHLLNAVQTKHSHGLSTDLKHYLSCSFPKNSPDKQLQDLIRENIYRRTIPCTTRPPKDGEIDKIDYYFLTKEQFVEMNNRGMLLECGMYGGHYYGTMKPFSDLNNLDPIYGSLNYKEISDEMRQPLNANHPAIGMSTASTSIPRSTSGLGAASNEVSMIPHTEPMVPINDTSIYHLYGHQPLYENHESLKMHQMQVTAPNMQQQSDQGGVPLSQRALPLLSSNNNSNNVNHYSNSNLASHLEPAALKQSSIMAVDSEALPHGWERVIDQAYGTYYIDHNTQRTQYERPYEIELTKSDRGFGFTLVEADNGVLLVRSVIPGGPAYMSGIIRPGDILVSAAGVSVAGSQHNDIARLFSTFAVGDRVRLIFARSTYVVDADLVPDEYLISNGTNGDLPIVVNSSYFTNQQQQLQLQQPTQPFEPADMLQSSQSPHILVEVDLDRENTDSNWGIRLIGGAEVDRAISIGSIVFGGAASKNGRLKSGDEIISINGINVVGATHQHVVELISTCSNRASLVVRRLRFGEACEVVLSRNPDEGFGFVIISSGNCALIGRIIEGSPADKCQQLHVRDRIIAVNGRYITPNMQHPEIVNMIKECGSVLKLLIDPVDCYTVELIKSAQNDNFGFSIRGGSEYDGMPLYVLRVASNGLARDLLNVGDQIIEINGIPTAGMTHQQAASIIKHSDPIVKLKLRRNYVTPPSLLVDSPRALQRFNQVTAEMKTVSSSSTPRYMQEGFYGSTTTEQQQQQQQQANSIGLQQQQQSSSLIDQQQQVAGGSSGLVYNQNSLPLYAT